MGFRKTWVDALGLVAWLVLGTAHAAKPDHHKSDMAILNLLLEQPDGSLDLARAKLSIDRMVDPSVNVEANLRLLDYWADKARQRIPRGATNRQKIDALITTLYDPGPWNDFRPFGYDYSDPMGRDIKTTLLSHYLETRKGQCVVMPMAFAFIAKRLSVDVALSTAPYHVLVKYGDETEGQWMNVEATSGRIYYDSQYEASMGISPIAIKNELYLRPYTQREAVSLFATTTLMQVYRAQENPERMLDITKLILDANPKDPIALETRANAYYLLIQRDFKRKYPKASQIPADELKTYSYYSKQNLDLSAKAEALGAKVWNKKDWDKYLKHFGRMKAADGQGGT